MTEMWRRKGRGGGGEDIQYGSYHINSVPFPVHVLNRVQQLLTWGRGSYGTVGVARFTKEV